MLDYRAFRYPCIEQNTTKYDKIRQNKEIKMIFLQYNIGLRIFLTSNKITRT